MRGGGNPTKMSAGHDDVLRVAVLGGTEDIECGGERDLWAKKVVCGVREG
jgi:hypothetical protein